MISNDRTYRYVLNNYKSYIQNKIKDKHDFKIKVIDTSIENSIDINQIIYIIVRELNLSPDYIESLPIDRFFDYAVKAKKVAETNSAKHP